jgi:phosphoesterase RecJ-like protein
MTIPTIAPNLEALEASLRLCAEEIRNVHTVVITSHQNGDGDSIGSSLGMYHLMRSLGKAVRVIHPTPLPLNFTFLQGSEAIETFDVARHTEALNTADVLCVLDANAPKRMRDMETLITCSPARKLVIDHHQDPQPFADVYAVDVEASSTCEIICRFADILSSQAASKRTLWTQAFAEALYTGIMTDTGNFRFPRTDAELHRMIARLIEAGADPTFIYENVINQNPFNRALLLGRALSGLQLFHNGKLCMMTVSQRDLAETGTNEDNVEGFVEQTLSLQGVQMGVLVVELSDQIKMSLRSKGAMAVNQIAAHFGGGGHLNAAGCRTKTHTFEQAQKLIIELSANVMQR